MIEELTDEDIPFVPYVLPSALDIRADYARAKVYGRFALAGREALRAAAIKAAEDYPNFNHSERCDLDHCPLLFADEPELAQAWARGVVREREAAAWCEEDMRDPENAELLALSA